MSTSAIQQRIDTVVNYTPQQQASVRAVHLAKKITIVYIKMGFLADFKPDSIKNHVEKRITMITKYSQKGVPEDKLLVLTTAHILIEKDMFSKEEIHELALMCGYKLTWNGKNATIRTID